MSVIGLRIGPYEIVGPAGFPGPGDWFVAHRTGAKRRQASEVLVRLLAPDADDRARADLQRQFEALKAIEDPRVPAALAFYEGSGALVIDLVKGTSLREAIAGRGDDSVMMTPATLLDVMLELADSLQRAHHRDRVHGHLDPQRVLVGHDGALWILGFGEEQAAVDPRWCPPELARGEAATAATDQWSLAALATALISGHPPWGKPADAAVGDPSAMVGPVEDQWPALARVLRRMLDPDPTARHPSLHPARQELLALARKAGGTSERRDLGTLLARRLPTPPTEPDDEELAITEGMPAVPVSEQPTRPVGDAVSAESEAPTVEVPAARGARTPAPPQRRAPQTPLPAEEIPVVRPDVEPDDLPVAHMAGTTDPDLPEETEEPEEPTADRTESIGSMLDRIATQQADVEPSDQTVLFQESALQKAMESLEGERTPMHVPRVDDAAAVLHDDDDSEDPDDEATVLATDLAALRESWGNAPTAVPVTESGEDEPPAAVDAATLGVSGEPSTGAEWFAEDPRATSPDEPSLGLGPPTVDPDLMQTELVEARRAPEVGPPPQDLSALRRMVPILLLLLGGLLVVWAAVRFF